MTVTATRRAADHSAARSATSGNRRRRSPGVGSAGRVSGLTLGVVTLWLSVIVLLPLAALVVASFADGPAAFWAAITSPVALAALGTTLLVSAAVALLNVVTGTLIAWVLVRDDFPGKRFVDALIDLPFALPTIVASIVLLSLYGPNSPIGVHLNATRWGLLVALAFVTLPFVVRSVQPVLIEIDRDVEQAAASLGANNWTIFRRVVLPTLAPAIISGAGLAFARAVGEYGSVVLIGGNIPRETQVASQYIQQQIEIDRPVNAAAVSVALLAISFTQRQRMALARALAVDPQVLLLDEPFGALDAKVREDLRRWLRRLHDEVHVTTVLVTHDQDEALDVADRIAVLNAGRIEQVGSPDELYDSPANPFVMSFLGSVSRLNGEVARPHDLRIERDRQWAVREAERTGVRVTEAAVDRLVRLGFEVRVELHHTHTGEPFFAQITRAEATGLNLAVGDVVWVLPTRTIATEPEVPALAG